MDNFKKFIEDLLDSKIKDLNRLSGGASAETYKICLSDHKNYILRKTPDSAESKLAISKKLEAIQKEYRNFVDIGSYPFFRLGKIGVSVVSRSTSKKKLINVNKDLMKIVRDKKIKILKI